MIDAGDRIYPSLVDGMDQQCGITNVVCLVHGSFDDRTLNGSTLFCG